MNTRVRIVECVQCRKTAAELNIPRLFACGTCNVTVYCGRTCQRAHWNVHKIFCAAWAANTNSFAAIFRAFMTQHPIYSVTTRLQNLETYIEKPFTKFDEGTFLHDRAKRDVFKLLIDSFRLRQDDEATIEGKITPNSIYAGATSSIIPFRHYLFEAAIIPNFLPPWWWDTDSKRECETFGESGEWTDLRVRASKRDMISHYGDITALVQLRMLAERIQGVGVRGTYIDRLRKDLVRIENFDPADGEKGTAESLNGKK